MLIGGLGSFEHGSFLVTDVFEGVRAGRIGTPTAPGRLSGPQFEGPGFLGHQRRPGEGVVPIVVDRIPADDQKLSGGGHGGDLPASASLDPLIESAPRTG